MFLEPSSQANQHTSNPWSLQIVFVVECISLGKHFQALS